MSHVKGFRIGFKVFQSDEDLQTHYSEAGVGFSDAVEVSVPIRTVLIDEGLGFADEIGCFRELVPVGISEGIGFSDEAIEDNFWFQGKYFGTLQNDYEDGTYTGTPDLDDYFVSFIPNEYIYWDDDLDTSDLELIVVFRLDDTGYTSLPTTDDVIWKSGTNVNGLSISVKRLADNQPYLIVTAASSSTNTSVQINLKNIDLETGVWMELFATPTKLVLREYDTPANSFTVVGSWTSGYADYYESIGASVGPSPVYASTSGYWKGSVRSIDYYHIGKIDMPADVNLYPFHFYSRFGTDNEGNGGRVSESGTPTINADWVTFDGNDAYYFSNNVGNEFDLTDIDVKFTFRLEEDHLDTLNGNYGIWNIGNLTDGFTFLVVDRELIFASRNNGTLQTNKVSVYNLEMDVWYEVFISTSKITIREEATPANGFTQSGTVDVNAHPTSGYHGLGSEVVYYIYDNSSGTWLNYTQMSVKELVVHKQGGLTFPTDFDAPEYGPVWRWNFGSDVGGFYDFTQYGDPTNNTDHIAFDGNDGLHQGDTHTDPHDRSFIIKFSYTSTFSAVQTLWKTGDEANGIAIGTDSSGNLGVFARSSSTLTSITIDAATDLSTSTVYYIYVSDTAVRVYDTAFSLMAEETGTITIGTLSGTQDNDSVGSSVYGCPIDGSTSTWNSYLTGNVYSVEWWEEDEFTFPPSNWHKSEGEIGFADTIDGAVNTAIGQAEATIGFTETTGGELISHVTGMSEGLGFDDTINVIESQTNFSEATIGFSETIGGEERSIRRDTADTIGFSDETGADHIDETSGEADGEIGFSDETGAYNATSRKEVTSIIGFNETVGGHKAVVNVGITSTFGIDELVDAYNSFFHKEVTSTIGFDETIDGKNIITRAEVLSALGLSDDVDGYNSFSNIEVVSEIGLADTIDANLTQIEGISEDLGLSDLVWGHATTRNVGFSSQLGLNGASLGGNPLNPDNEGEIGFNDTIGATHYPVKGISATLGLDDEIIPIRQYESGIANTIGFDDSAVGENAGDLLVDIPANVTYNFFLTLTGANDGETDYEITQLKTIQFRMKSGTQSSYLGVTAIHTDEAEAAINLRTNGTLVLDMASYYEGVEVLREEMMEVSFSDVRHDIGSSSGSMTINGYGVLTYNTDVVFLANSTRQKTNQDGRVSYRFARPNFYVRPGYKVVYGLENFTVDEVAFILGYNYFYMDVYFDSSTLSGANDNDIYREYSLATSRSRRFFATLTGSPNGVDDYLLPSITNIQVRLSSGRPSYASVTVLYSQDLKDAIALRPDGDLVIDYIDGDGASQTELVSVNFNDVSYDLLPMSRTATLVGYRTTGYSSTESVVPDDVIEHRVNESGEVNLRSITPNLAVTPGYTIVYGGYEFMAGNVAFNFQAYSQSMDINNTVNITTEQHVEVTIGIEGDVISNIFYTKHGESEFGLDESAHVSFNDVENAYSDTSEIGFTDFIGYELNP